MVGTVAPSFTAFLIWLSFFRFFLLCYQFVPVSLYVTMTLVYAMQSFFMQNDLQMFESLNPEDSL